MRRGSELLDHPQMQHLGAVVEIDDAERGLVRQPGPIVKMSDTPAVLERGAPVLDADGAAAAGGAVGRRWARRTSWPARDRRGGTRARRRDPARARDLLRRAVRWHGAARAGGPGRSRSSRSAGEPMRTLLPFPEVGAAKCMQGKESICVDLSTDEGRAIVHALARSSDIVLQSFRAGVAEAPGCRRRHAARGSTPTSSTSTRRATGSTDPAATAPPTRRPSVPAAASSCATSARRSRSDRVCR